MSLMVADGKQLVGLYASWLQGKKDVVTSMMADQGQLEFFPPGEGRCGDAHSGGLQSASGSF